MIRQGHLIAVVGTFLIGCAFLLLIVGCAGTSSESSNKEQGSAPKATESEEEARCEGTRTYHRYIVFYANGMNGPVRTGSEEDIKKADKKPRQRAKDLGVYTTNDLPGCPKGGLLLGSNKRDKLSGKHGDDEVRGLGGSDHYLEGGPGNDIIYGGDGDDPKGEEGLDGGPGSDIIYGGDGDDGLLGGNGADVLYSGDGNDIVIDYYDEQRDKLYCGEGRDEYIAVKNDYVDSSCEKKVSPMFIFGGEA